MVHVMGAAKVDVAVHVAMAQIMVLGRTIKTSLLGHIYL